MKKLYTASSIVQCDELRLYLLSGGVECTILNENLSTVANVGLPTHPLIPPELWVEDSDYESAMQLVAEHENRDRTLSEDYGPEPKGTRLGTGIMLGLLMAAVLFGIWFTRPDRRTGIVAEDTTGDGKPDTWHHLKRGVTTKIEQDENVDGRVDAWWYYTDGILSQGWKDVDFNGIPDVTLYFQNGRITHAEWYPNYSETLVKKEVYRDGNIIEEWIDENRDGRFDKLITYDWMGIISSMQEL